MDQNEQNLGSRRTNEFDLIEIGENWIDSLDRIDDANGPSKNDRIEANKKTDQT